MLNKLTVELDHDVVLSAVDVKEFSSSVVDLNSYS